MSNKVPSKKTGNKKRSQPTEKTNVKKTIVLIVMILVAFGAIVFLSTGTIRAGADNLKAKYDEMLHTEKEKVYQEYYNHYYEQAEREYHVANRVSINIEGIRETATLEVLEVSDVEYIIERGEENRNNISSWLEVPGTGMYVVDLEAAEFLVDDEHSYVCVRVPNPVLTNIQPDYKNIKKLLFKNDILNDSYKVGEDLAFQQLHLAELKIKKEFASNQHFYKSAQEAAKTTIQFLVKQLNPEIEDLTVEVEFL